MGDPQCQNQLAPIADDADKETPRAGISSLDITTNKTGDSRRTQTGVLQQALAWNQQMHNNPGEWATASSGFSQCWPLTMSNWPREEETPRTNHALQLNPMPQQALLVLSLVLHFL